MIGEKASQLLFGSPRRRSRRSYLATVRSDTSKPSFAVRHGCCGAPQPEFSAAMVRMRVRISALTFGRPATAIASANRGESLPDANRPPSPASL